MATWNADPEPIWPELLPLRHAVCTGTAAAWPALQNHSLYRYRAQFEMALA